MNPHMSPHMSVGKTVANWTPIFANWIQLANACQLDVSVNLPRPEGGCPVWVAVAENPVRRS
jgi:hypothetical protein